MSVPVAYVCVIILWSTTPLAIQWSSADWGFLFGVAGRMSMGAALCACILLIRRNPLPLDRASLHVYLAGGFGIFFPMLSLYWSAQFIPSGLIAVIFGLSPIVTAVLAAWILGEDSLTKGKLFAVSLGFLGIYLIFGSDFSTDLGHSEHAWLGILGMVLSMSMHCLAATWLKRVNHHVAAFHVTSGSLFVSAPLFVLVWIVFDGQWPAYASVRTIGSLVYLGSIATLVGFTLFYFVLKKVHASKVALLSLITPTCALLLGQQLNNEVLPLTVWIGSGCIVTALFFHQWGDRILDYLKMRNTGIPPA